ncbi:CHAT domain-containing protein, partial [Thermodesulfobacteriota bacterium]
VGYLYLEWGMSRKALKHYDAALKMQIKMGSLKDVGSTLISIGGVHAQMGDFQQALDKWREARRTFEELGASTRRADNNIAYPYMEMGNLGKAEEIILDTGFTESRARLFLIKARFKEAQTVLERLLKSGKRNRDASTLFTALTGLGLAYEGQGKLAPAAEYFRKAVDFTEELRSGLSRSQRETFFNVRINGFYRTEPYEGLARVLMKMNKPLEAFKGSEYTKARLFAESMVNRSDAGSSGVPPEVLKKHAELADELAALKKSTQEAYAKGQKEVIVALEPQVRALKDKRSIHVKMLREKYPLFAATKYPEPMGLHETAVEPDEWILSYDVTDTGVLIYLTQGKKLVKGLFKDIAWKDLDDLIRKFREPLSGIDSANYREKLASFDFKAGKRLADLLVAEALESLPERTPLIVVPDDSLGLIPFEALLLSDSGEVRADKDLPNVVGSEFLGDRNPISYYQSITALTLARTYGKRGETGSKLLVMADPVFGGPDDPRTAQGGKLRTLDGGIKTLSSDDNALFWPRVELTAELGSSLKALDPSAEIYMGNQASKWKLLDLPLTRYHSMVFATHGYFGEDLPGIREPVLVLTLIAPPKGQDGFLRMSEVMGLNFNADLVALTACQSGLGRRISGEGTMGMGRAFQYAGARSVLMSLWTVHEYASVKMVRSFFSRRNQGKSKLEALRLARVEIREQDYSHPFFWAPFILVGEVR